MAESTERRREVKKSFRPSQFDFLKSEKPASSRPFKFDSHRSEKPAGLEPFQFGGPCPEKPASTAKLPRAACFAKADVEKGSKANAKDRARIKASRKRRPSKKEENSFPPPPAASQSQRINASLSRKAKEPTMPNLLHNEMLEFIPTVIPDNDQKHQVDTAVGIVTFYAKSLWPESDVKTFGSWKTGLALSSSNLDLALILGSVTVNEESTLKRFALTLKEQELCVPEYLPRLITDSRYPHISCCFALSEKSPLMETCIYISGGRYNFLETTIAMQNQLQDKPALKQLTLAVKYMCKINHLLDEKKGGVSSFTVGKYAVAYLDKAKHPETANLGDIFLGFLEYYGEQSGLGIDRICQDGSHFRVALMTKPDKENVDERYQEGDQHSHHLHDPMDGYSLQDRAKAEHKQEKEEEEAKKNKPRPTEIAKSHGNQPSRGAVIDEEIENEEHEYLKRKGKI